MWEESTAAADRPLLLGAGAALPLPFSSRQPSTAERSSADESPLLRRSAGGETRHSARLHVERGADSEQPVAPRPVLQKGSKAKVLELRNVAAQLPRNYRSFVTGQGTYNIDRRWSLRERMFELWLRDKFHFLLGMPMGFLLAAMFFAYIAWAVLLSIALAVATKFDVQRCLGGYVTSSLNFYTFTVETMFAIGFGAPRFPSCPAADAMVSVIVVSTTLFNSMVLGLIFAKFSSGTRRRCAVHFSSRLLGNALESKLENYYLLTGNFKSATVDARQNETATKGREPLSLGHVASPGADGALDSRLSRGVAASAPIHLYGPAGETGVSRMRASRTTVGGGQSVLPRLLPRQPEGIGGAEYRQVEENKAGEMDAWGGPRPYSSETPIWKNGDDDDGQEPPPWQNKAADSSSTKPPHWENSNSGDSSNFLTFSSHTSDSFTLSFRVMNLTDQPFFKTQLSLFLLTHGQFDIQISRINTFYADMPLELLELPTTVTIDSGDLVSSQPLRRKEMESNGGNYEILALLTFTDNRTSRTIEVRQSWRLDSVVWGAAFAGVLRRKRTGAYEVDIAALDEIIADGSVK